MLGLSCPVLSQSQECESKYYRGFDTRLEPNLLMAVPERRKITAFEVWNDRVFLAAGSNVLLANGAGPVKSLDVGEKIESLTVDNHGKLSVRTSKQYWNIGPDGLIQDELLSALDRRILVLASGTPSYLGIGTNERITSLGIVNRKGLAAPLYRTRDKVVAASWSPEGMAALTSSELISWDGSSSKLTKLKADPEFLGAEDIVLLPSGRVVICLRNYILLVGQDSAIVIAGFQARVRYQQRSLYLLDVTTNLIWKIDNLDAIGDRQSNQNHAARLLSKLSPNVSETDKQFLEAARIIGCEEARQRLKTLR